MLSSCASKRDPNQPPQVDRSRIDRAFQELEGGGQPTLPREDIDRRAHPSTDVNDGPQPEWVRRRPVDTRYYHGIGTSNSNQSEARARALGDLASEIEAQVSSVVESVVEERGYSGSRGSEALIITVDRWQVRVLAQQTIRDPEWIGHWSGGEGQWAYARISKQQVRAQLESELADAQRLAVDHLVSGQRMEKKGDVVDAVQAYVRGLGVLRNFLGRPVEATVGGRRVIVNGELLRGADRNLDTIEITRVSSGSILATSGKGVAEPLEVRVERDGRGLGGVPVLFEFVRGGGDLVAQVQSDGRGRARSRISRVDAGTHIVSAHVDLAALAFGRGDVDPGLAEILSQIGGQSVEFHIGGMSKRMFVDITETNLGAVQHDSYFARLVKDRLAEASALQFAASTRDADLLLEGESSTRFSSQMGAVVFCYADVSVRLIEQSTGIELFSTRQTGVKGAARTQDDAALRAVEKAAKVIVEKLLPYIKREIEP